MNNRIDSLRTERNLDVEEAELKLNEFKKTPAGKRQMIINKAHRKLMEQVIAENGEISAALKANREDKKKHATFGM